MNKIRFFETLLNESFNVRSLFKNKENLKFEILDELETEKWFFIAPLNFESMEYLASEECGDVYLDWPEAERDEWWKESVSKGSRALVIAFNKSLLPDSGDSYNLKFLLKVNSRGIQVIGGEALDSYEPTYQNYEDVFEEEFYKKTLLPNEIHKVCLSHKIKQKQLSSFIKELDAKLFEDNNGKIILVVNEGVEVLPKIAETKFSKFQKKINKLVLPSSCKEISKSALEDDNELEEIEFSTGLEIIGNYAFRNCRNLKKIDLPKGLKKIYNCVFYGCPIDNVKVPNSVEALGSEAFPKAKKLYIPKSVKCFGGFFRSMFSSWMPTMEIDYEGSEEDFKNSSFIEDLDGEVIPEEKVNKYIFNMEGIKINYLNH